MGDLSKLMRMILLVAIAALVLPASGHALKTEFSGQIQSKYIARDTSGFQYGFMDDTESVQWKQELQLDLEVEPEYVTGEPLVRFEKAFFRYRGAYDAIFDLNDDYDGIREKSPDDFELGKDDLEYENELREGYVDFAAENSTGSTQANLRLGRQIVQWGEADGFNLMNIINPSNYSDQMFFSDVEDLAIPLWMGRLDASTPAPGPFATFNLQLVAVPDVRPTQFAPLGQDKSAPYAFSFRGLGSLPVKEDVPTSGFDNMEYGVRAGFNGFYGWNGYLYYFDGYQNSPAIDFSKAAYPPYSHYTFRHPEQETYGYSFNKFVGWGNFVFRGEGSLTTNHSMTDFEKHPIRGYSLHDFYQVLFGIDKNISGSDLPIGTRSALVTSFQAYYNKVKDYEPNALYNRTAAEDTMRLTMLLQTDYFHGTTTPSLFVMYDTAGTWMTSLGVNWSPDGNWFVDVSQMSYYGDTDARSAFSPYIDTASEVSMKVGYRW